MKHHIVWSSALISLFLLFSTEARADILVSNLSEPFRSNTPIGNPEFWAAQSFITDGFSYDLQSIEIIGGNAQGSPDVVAELRAATGTLNEIDMSASGLLGTFVVPDLSGATTVRTFLPNGNIALDPATTYWIVVGSANGGTFDWSYADSNFFSGPGSLGLFADSSDAGISWTYGDTFPFFIQVNVSAIPEPFSAWILGGLVVLGGTTYRPRRQSLFV